MTAPRGRIWAETGKFVGFIESHGPAIEGLAMNNRGLHFGFVVNGPNNRAGLPVAPGQRRHIHARV